MSEYVAVLHEPTLETRPFWDACDAEEFLLQHCPDCSRQVYPPRLFCPHCGLGELPWKPALTTGTVYSFTHVFVSFNGDFWRSQLPYTSVIIDLDAGVRFISRLIGSDREDVRVGDRVRIRFVPVGKRKLPFVERMQDGAAAQP